MISRIMAGPRTRLSTGDGKHFAKRKAASVSSGVSGEDSIPRDRNDVAGHGVSHSRRISATATGDTRIANASIGFVEIIS
jgi:hypothetical protein